MQSRAKTDLVLGHVVKSENEGKFERKSGIGKDLTSKSMENPVEQLVDKTECGSGDWVFYISEDLLEELYRQGSVRLEVCGGWFYNNC